MSVVLKGAVINKKEVWMRMNDMLASRWISILRYFLLCGASCHISVNVEAMDQTDITEWQTFLPHGIEGQSSSLQVLARWWNTVTSLEFSALTIWWHCLRQIPLTLDHWCLWQQWTCEMHRVVFRMTHKCFQVIHKLKIKSVAYSSQGSHTDQLDFCNWLADGSTTG